MTYVREQLGHSSIEMTVDVYGHLAHSANRATVALTTRPRGTSTEQSISDINAFLDSRAPQRRRTLLGQPADAPTAEPMTAEQIRISHNVAVANDDRPTVARWRAELARRLDVTRAAKFDDGTELPGTIHGRGAERGMTLYFLTGPKGIAPHVKFSVSAKVTRAPKLSMLPLDPEVIGVGLPPTVPSVLWQPGKIYSVKFTYRHRPGTEQLLGNFRLHPRRARPRARRRRAIGGAGGAVGGIYDEHG